MAVGGDLKRYRQENGLRQVDLAEMLGYKIDSLARAERNRNRELSPKMQEAFSRLLAAGTASPAAEPPPDGPEPAAAPDGGEPAADVAADSPGSADLPPLAADPEPPAADDGETLTSFTGKKVTVSSIGHYGRIELSMFVFFAGKEIQYNYPTPDGKVARATVHQPGLADFLPDPRDGAVVRDHAAEMAHAWAEWARTNGRVNWLLSFFILEGGAKGVAAATFPVVLTILRNHGIDPLTFFLAPLENVAGRVGAVTGDNGRPAPDDGLPRFGDFGFEGAEGVEQ